MPEVPRCPACAAAFASDQRYCLECGTRVAGSRVDWEAELGVRARAAATAEREAVVVAPPAARAQALPGRRLALHPHPMLAAGLVLATLGTGVLAGDLAAQGTAATRARSVVVAAQSPRPAAPSPVASPATPPPSGALLDDVPEPAAPAEDPEPADPAPAASPAPPAAAAEPAAAPAIAPSEGLSGAGPEVVEGAPPAATGAAIDHVWVVGLRGDDAARAFGPQSPAAMLSRELPSRGALLRNWTSLGAGPLADRVALLSGRPCEDATDPCLRDADVPTLLDRLTSAGRSWRAYVEAPDAAELCDPAAATALAVPNPVLRLAVLDGECSSGVAPLGALAGELAAERAPAFAYVLPGRCHDGGPADCPGADPDPLVRLDGWLRAHVAPILESKAFKTRGLLLIVLDGAPAGVPAAVAVGAGGLVEPGTEPEARVGPLALLRTLGDAFGIPPLGEAEQAEPFPGDVLVR